MGGCGFGMLSDGVLPNGGVSAYGRCEVTGVLGNICVRGWVCCDYCLLKAVEPVCFRVFSPDTL